MNLAEISIRRPIFISCVVILTLVLGGVSLSRMSVDLFPDVSFPILFVQSVYPGASPEDMEKLVSKPIEDELGGLSNLNKISSQNLESLSAVILEFKIGTDIKDRENQVRQRLANIRRNLPQEVKDPVIRRFDPADQAVARLAVLSELPPAEVFDLVDNLVKSQFETINGVGQVSISGGRKKEIQILVDLNKLQERKLSLNQVADRIRSSSKDIPVGTIKTSENESVIRAVGEFASLEELKKVNVSFFGSDQVVRLDSIARVQEGLVDEKSRTALLSRARNFERVSSVYVDIFKQSGENTVRVVDAVLKQIEKVNKVLQDKNLSARVELVREGAKPIRLNIADVRESILIGILLCVVVVFFFLGSGRSTFITGMALPNSLLGGFILMAAMGFSINIMTLLALSLAVGLLIDDAIVVRENIFRHIEMGKTPREAALVGTQEVALAVIATTMVVIAVFGPIAFLDGIIGQFFKQFGLTVVFTMLISLFDAFTVAPMLSAYMATQEGHSRRGLSLKDRMLNAFDRFQTGLENSYSRILAWTLDHRGITLFMGLLIFIGSLALTPFIPKNFLPGADTGEFAVSVETPVGSSLDETARVTKDVEDLLKAHPAVDLISSVVGSTSGQDAPTRANLYVRLVPRKKRDRATPLIKAELREIFKPLQGRARVNLGEVDIGGGSEKVFNVNLVGENLQVLSAYADRLKAKLQENPGLADVDSNYRSGKPEFHVVFDRARSESLGVSTVMAGAELRSRVEGVVPTVFRQSGREYDIRVILEENQRDLRKFFQTSLVPNVNMNMIPLPKVARAEDTSGYSQINRQNKARFINLDANLSPKGSLGTVTSDVKKLIEEDPQFRLPEGVSYRFRGQAEDFQDLLNNMLMALLLGVIFIYLVLASLYESFVTPLAILLALPLAISGAFLGLLIFGKSLDIFSMIGFILLMGVVAKNSILLVDYTQQLMDQGVARTQALMKACVVRLRPILMTSLALIAGTIPIAVGLNEASAQRTSMGVAIIGGLLSSTLLTLVVVPAAFGYIDDFRVWVRKKVSKVLRVDGT